MLKRMLFAAALTGLVAGAAISLHAPSAEAASGCWAAAKAKFPGDAKARRAYRKECRAHYKAYKTATKGAKKAT
jgi:hypothetical protein